MHNRLVNESKTSGLCQNINYPREKTPTAHQIRETPNATAEPKSKAGALRESFAFKLAE